MEAFHPGEFLKEEADARHMTLSDVAELLERRLHDGMDRNKLQAIVDAKEPITVPIALAVEGIWEISAEYWLGMQQAWDLQEARKENVIA